MKQAQYTPSIIDFAYEIIDLNEENMRLRQSLDHYKQMHELHCADLSRRDKHTADLTGIMLKAVIDPDSVINKGHAAILREQIEG